MAWSKSWSEGKVVATTNLSRLSALTFNKKAKVLDVGCGNGATIDRLSKAYGVDVYGVDIVAIKNSHPIVKADALHLPFKDGVFNVVFGLGSIEHCCPTQEAIKEAYRVLTVNGQVLFTVPNRLSLHTLIERPLRQKFGLWGIGLEQSFSLGQFHKMFSNAGFSGVDHSLILWNTARQSIPLRVFMMLDNFFHKVCAGWGFFICVFGKKVR